MRILNGFVKLHRKFLVWGWYQDNVVKSVFLHLLLTASYTDCEWMGIKIKKGQVVVSYAKLAEDTGNTVQQVRTAIKKLKKTGEITSKSTNQFTVVTIVKWGDYQNYSDEATSKITNEQQTDNKRITNEQQHNKNIKNNKNYKNNTRVYETQNLKKNKFCNFSQKPFDYEAIKKRNMEELLEILAE